MQNGYLSVTREIYTGNPVSLNRVKCRRMYGKNENFIVIYHASENFHHDVNKSTRVPRHPVFECFPLQI